MWGIGWLPGLNQGHDRPIAKVLGSGPGDDITGVLIVTSPPVPSTPANMRSVAELTGFSIMTVSRALRDHPRVKAETKATIKAAAGQLGYRPNPMVSALMTQRRSNRRQDYVATLALVHCLPDGAEFSENMRSFKAAVCEHANGLGFQVESFHLHEPGMTLNRLMEIIRARGIRGIIWEHFFSANNRLDHDFSDFACVIMGNTVVEPNFHQIESDRFAEMRLALDNLRSLGYRRIGYCSVRHIEISLNYKRLCAMLLEQSQTEPADRVPWLEVETFHNYENAVWDWLARNRPEVVVSQNKYVYGYIRRAGLRVPADIGFLHLGHHPSFKDFAGIDPNWNERGVIAVDRVVALLNQNEYGVPSAPLITYVDHRWAPGPSLRQVGPAREPLIQTLSSEQLLED